MIKISKEVQIGFIAVIALVLLYIGINYLKGNKLFNKGSEYYAIYERVEGLTVDKKVLVNGLPVGKVRTIDFIGDGSGRLIVGMVIFNKNIRVPIGSTAKIASTDFFGTRAIDLILADTVAEYYEPGDTLRSAIEGDLLTELSKKFKPLENKSSNFFESMDSTLYIVKKTFADADSAILEINDILKAEGPRIIRLTDNLNSITGNLKNSNDTITAIINNFHNISDSIAQSRIKETLLTLNTAMKDLETVMAKINNGEGTIGLLLNDSTLYDNLNKASADLDSLLIDVRENPGRYVQVSVFGGKNKKKKE